MPKTVSVLVEIPDNYELAEPAMRCPKVGEHYPLTNGTAKASYDWASLPMVILRPEWKWPKELGSKFAAVIQWSAEGEWFATTRMPEMEMNGWWGSCGDAVRLRYFDWWTPPPCSDWKQSLRKNPNVKE